jgi:hypothetical protein
VIESWGGDDGGEMSIEDKIEELGVRGMDGMVAAVDSVASLVKGSIGAVGRGRGAAAADAIAAGIYMYTYIYIHTHTHYMYI